MTIMVFPKRRFFVLLGLLGSAELRQDQICKPQVSISSRAQLRGNGAKLVPKQPDTP